MDKKKIFLCIAIFWLVLIMGFIGLKEFTLQTGEEILLKTRPVDPRDLFRGDYVILNYEISTLDYQALLTDSAGFSNGDSVYVALDIVGKHGVAAGIFRNRPKENLFVKGTVQRVRGHELDIRYGIESYFVPEGKGRAIERARGGSLEVKASIDQFGNAVIKSLLLNGKQVDFK